MSTHEHVAPEDLTTVALGMVDKVEPGTVLRHIRDCLHCQDELAQIREDFGLYARMTRLHEVPDEKGARILDQIAREKRYTSPWPISVGLSGNHDTSGNVEGSQIAGQRSRPAD